MKPTRALLLAVLTLTLGAGACGGGGTALTPDAWAAAFCGAAGDLQKSLEALNTGLQSAVGNLTDLEAARAALVKFLEDATDATGELGNTVERLGVPEVTDGKEIHDLIVEGTGKAEKVFADSVEEAKNLPTGDPAAFVQGATDLGQALEQGGAEIESFFSELENKFEGNPLDKSFNTVPACTALG